ncbi:MAG: aminomethyl-transferring glycine dehydrogenase subunit GcvPA [Endomicrobiales bacterium]|nr:aminomethyl-transferring glycine dehydrogenase subunit GcvPA [Endomicrobiales bacterium]
MDYIPITEKEKQEMLERIGVKCADELFAAIPQSRKVKELNLPKGISEQSLIKRYEKSSNNNKSLNNNLNFLGAGIYEHFIPSLVEEITGRSEFSTAYTPYQPEASQGTLQSIFEYQSLVVELTGMEVTNASLYDGASAVAEAALLAIRSKGLKKILVSEALHPEYQQVLGTYLQGIDVNIVPVPIENGTTSISKAKELVSSDCAALILQSPNFLGTIEDIQEFKNIIEKSGVLLINVVNPISLGILKSPGEAGADIAVGEGQVLGNASGFGGFTFGFLACKKAFSWKMPGRIVGQTTDSKGRRGYVLTLQSREQHIRREKATSNICTNSALNALAGCVYLAGWGKNGIRELAKTNLQKSHYAFDKITKIPGFEPAFKNQSFFNEFAVKTKKDIKEIQKKLLSGNIIGPFELSRFYKEYSDCLLFCVTETKTKEDIDKLIEVLKGC